MIQQAFIDMENMFELLEQYPEVGDVWCGWVQCWVCGCVCGIVYVVGCGIVYVVGCALC